MGNRNLYIKQYDRMVKDLISEIDNGGIVLDPDYQRNYVWDNKKASLLVESILLNVPIPVLYAAESDDNKWVVVDGLQRLYSLHRFFKDEFSLKDLETLHELNGDRFSEMAPDLQRRIGNGELRVIVIQKDSDPEIQFDIFQRLNTGSVQLNEQELRNCIYRGPYNEMIKRFVKDSDVFHSFKIRKMKRMQGEELAIRYLALSQNYDWEEEKINGYDGRLKNLLNRHMSEHQNASPEECELARKKLEEQVEKAFEVFGTDAFMPLDGSSINSSLFDCVMLSFEKFKLEDLRSYKSQIIDAHQALLTENQLFIESIQSATANTKMIINRLSIYYAMLRSVLPR